jgi:hypothetical protein
MSEQIMSVELIKKMILKKLIYNELFERKQQINKNEIGEALYSQLFKNCCTEEEIKEYVETRKLKRYVKKYNLSKKR